MYSVRNVTAGETPATAVLWDVSLKAQLACVDIDLRTYIDCLCQLYDVMCIVLGAGARQSCTAVTRLPHLAVFAVTAHLYCLT